MSDSEHLSAPERWAAAQASRQPLGRLLALVFCAVVIVAIDLGSPSTRGNLWIFVPFWLALVFEVWEQLGYKRLLARRDAEIERLRSSGGSA